MSNLNLDFSIESSEGRKDFVDQYLSNNPDLKFSNSELETIANYILYGKDSDGTSIVDRGEVEIDTKYNTYQRKKPESLDELTENPAFDERIVLDPSTKNHYKVVKPKIDREKDSYIPGIQELWAQIDRWQYLIDVTTGKIDDSSVKKLSPLNLYKARHHIVELRRQQFYLKDAVAPTILMFKTNVHQSYYREDNSIPWDCADSDYSIAPLGIITPKDPKFIDPRNYRGLPYSYNSNAIHIIDFRNQDHIYYLLEAYEDLKCAADRKPESLLNGILDTLDFYCGLANLSPLKQRVLEMKKRKKSNNNIHERVNKEFGTTYSANYISTIWKQKVCGEIAEAARLHYDWYLKREETFAWKRCNQCGKIKLKDTREFMRKSRSSDGFSNRCKECDKENRERNR